MFLTQRLSFNRRQLSSARLVEFEPFPRLDFASNGDCKTKPMFVQFIHYAICNFCMQRNAANQVHKLFVKLMPR